MLPLNKLPIYSTWSPGLKLAPWLITSSFGRTGEGPKAFGFDENPFPLATHNFLLITRTEVGYQPTGINPFATLSPGSSTSKTAIQLLFAFAKYKRLLIASKLKLLVVEPLGAFGKSAASNVSITVLDFKSITETLLSFELQTYKYLPSGVTNISFGLSPTLMDGFQLKVVKSSVFTWSHPQQLT